MEKVKLGFEMATRWSDPTIMLIGMLPLGATLITSTTYFAMTQNKFTVPLTDIALNPDVNGFNVLTLLPIALLLVWWNFIYHTPFEDKSVDTSKYVTFRSPSMAKYWKHRPIPMCELYEMYIEEKCDWNTACEGGDCFLILDKHRYKFINFKITKRQIKWLLSQFLPQWVTGAGLGKGSSSGKSIAETTKEIDEHYNKGNDVFSCILGKAMVYTCGVFHKIPEFASTGFKGDYAASAADGTLEEAQRNKMDMVCQKVHLEKGETFLDIGCGWGTLMRHAVAHYGATATGVTLSREGKIWCDMASEKEGIPTKVHCCDYREIPGGAGTGEVPAVKFDKIASIEMAEHVGVTNFVDPYLKTVRSLLAKKDSKFLIQVSGLRQGSNWEDVAWGLFMGKYIFPGADASTPLNWYVKQLELAGFEVHSVETIGRHYSHTLHKWYDNWMSHKDEILSGKIDAISDHSRGAHLFRLQEFFLAWSVIASGQGTATCYQILAHPNEYDYPRDQWVTKEHALPR